MIEGPFQPLLPLQAPCHCLCPCPRLPRIALIPLIDSTSSWAAGQLDLWISFSMLGCIAFQFQPSFINSKHQQNALQLVLTNKFPFSSPSSSSLSLPFPLFPRRPSAPLDLGLSLDSPPFVSRLHDSLSLSLSSSQADSQWPWPPLIAGNPSRIGSKD